MMATRLVVEWTRTTLRLALAEGSGLRARVRAIRSQPIGVTGEVSEALRSLLKTVKPAAASVIGVVSREQVITRVLKFPTTEPDELARMVELYAKGQLPYPREQAVMDFHVLNQQGGFSTVAVVACQREVVDRQLAMLRDAGLPVLLLTVSSWGVLGWYRQAALVRPAKEPSLVINVDDTRTDLVLVANGRVLSSRSISQGAQDWEALGETAELLALEVERSRAAIRKELPGAEVRSLVLTGLGALAQWSDQLSQRLSLSVTAVEAKQPFRGATVPTTPAISPVVIGGLACSDPRGLLNLSPPEMRVQVHHRQQVQELVMVSLLLGGVLALGSSLLALQVSRHQQMAAQLDQVLADVEPTAKQVQEKTRSSQLVSSTLEDRRRLSAILAGVFLKTPSAVTLEALTFERARQELVVRGSAGSTQEVLGYVKRLEDLQGVRGVDLKYTTQRVTPNGERTDFELILRQQAAAS